MNRQDAIELQSLLSKMNLICQRVISILGGIIITFFVVIAVLIYGCLEYFADVIDKKIIDPVSYYFWKKRYLE